MENNEPNIKPQQTGGLKLMTVFIAVLALHVIVIGGFTVYHLLGVATSDQDVTLDKNHKGAKTLSDSALAGDLPNTDSTDKTITPAASSTDTTTPPANTASPDTASTAPAAPASETASTPASTSAETPSTPASVASTESAPTAQTPSGPIQHGPVIDPPENLAPKEPTASDASSMAASPDSAPAADGASYIVKRGDSLARIARQHHVSLAKLRSSNSFSSDMLHIGQKIVIPNRTQTVALAANAESPAPSEDVTAPAMPTHHAAKASLASTGGHRLYTVVKGDTIIKIARRFRTTPTALMTANNLTNAGKLSIGKKLRIPSGESRSAATSIPAAPSAPTESKAAPKGQLANFVQ
jgi:LysM repeat protein